MTTSRFTQDALEAVDSPTPSSRFTQDAVEAVGSPTPTSRFTQDAVEALVSATTRSRFSQDVLEVLTPFAFPLTDVATQQLWPGGPTTTAGTAGGDLDGDYPDPEVVALKGLPMVGTLGANQVWAKDPSADQLIPSTPGSPTALYTVWDPFIPDASPHSLTREFDSSSLSGLTQINCGDAGVVVDADTTVPGSLCIEMPTQQYKWRALVDTLPGDTNFTIHSAIMVAGQNAASLIIGGGILLSDTNTNNTGSQTAVSFGHVDQATEKYRLVWNGFGNTATGALATPRIIQGGPFCFLRFRLQSGTYYVAWSGDGLTWDERSSTLLGSITPVYFGLYGQNYSGQGALRVSFPYLRYYDTGTQLTTGALRTVYE